MCFEETSIPLLHTHNNNTHTASVSNPHICAGDEAFALHVAGPKELLGLVQQGDWTPVWAPPPWAQSKAIHPALRHVWDSFQGTPGQQQCASSMYFSNSQEWNQTSGLLTGTVSSALGLLQSPWRQRREVPSDDEAADNFVAHAYTQKRLQAPVRHREMAQILIQYWETWHFSEN